MKHFLSIGEAMVEVARVSDTSDHWRLGFAGDTLNTAWYAQACLPKGWQVDYLTRLGQDMFSQQFLNFLGDHSIGCDHIAVDDTRTIGLYAIQLTAGERSFSYWRSQSAARLLAEDTALMDRAFAQADCIYLSGITLAIIPPSGREALLSRLQNARAQGKMTAFDPNIRPSLWENPTALREWLTRAAGAAQIVLPSYDDEATWFGDLSLSETASRWSNAGAQEVVVKNGGGTIAARAAGEYREFHLPEDSPVDSTGAGDSFNGAYIAARLSGSTCKDAVTQAHAIARKVIAAHGALVRL
jgi:2-dehydro-3-deoxygluconokinase